MEESNLYHKMIYRNIYRYKQKGLSEKMEKNAFRKKNLLLSFTILKNFLKKIEEGYYAFN
jgi:hypothetical protein